MKQKDNLKTNGMSVAWMLPLLLAGCSDELHQLYPTASDGKVPVELAASIEQVSDTRADESGFADGDRFGVFVVNYEQDLPGTLTLSGNQANNVAFTYNADSNTWNAATDIYWRDNVTPADVYGYYPFDNGMGDVNAYRFEVEPDQSVAKEGEMGKYEASDLLRAKASRALPGKKVDLTFSHILAGVKVNLVQGADFQWGIPWDELTKTITVDNTIRTASVDLSTGIATPDGNTDRNVVMNPESGDTYRAVVVPQTVAAGKSIIGITIDGVTYHYNRTDGMTYTAGKLHNFTIKVDRKTDGGGYALSLVSEDVTDWEADKSSHDFVENAYVCVHCPEAGKLREALNDAHIDFNSIKNLKITGTLTTEDFELIRNELQSISAININDVSIINVRYQIYDDETGLHIREAEENNMLPEYAFSWIYSLRRVILPKNLKKIGSDSFHGLNLRSTIIIPDGVTEIMNAAFCDTKGSFSIELPNNLEKIGGGAFLDTEASIELKLPKSLKHIGTNAFLGAKNIYGTFQLPTELEYLGDSAFDGCGTNLTGDIIIPEKIKEIPNTAFNEMGFRKPINLKLHDGITKIGGGAFGGLKFASVINFPRNLKSIGNGAFINCTFTGDVLLPEELFNLGNEAFSNTNIKGTLEIPNSIEMLGSDNADFWIDVNGPFSGTQIERLIIGDNVQLINDYASSRCQQLTYISIGKNITHIGKSAFEGCQFIQTIVCMAKEPPTLDETAFRDIDYSQCVVEVPEKSVEAYRNAPAWNKFQSITPHHELNFSVSEFSCLNKGISRTLMVRADGPWEVTECPSWIHVNPNKADYKEEVTITVDPISIGTSNREAKVVFKLKNSEYTNYMTIRQYDYEYEEDKEIVLQTASSNGNPINVFIVGEGYGAESIVNGQFMTRCNETMENLFAIEPYKTYRNMFTVSTAIALSPDNEVQDMLTLRETKFGLFFPEINDNVVKDYVKNVSKSINDGNIGKSLIIILANYESFAGNSYISDYDNCSIAFIANSNSSYPFDNRGLIQHFVGGSAFAGLATEDIQHIETIKGCTCPGCNGLATYYSMKARGFFENITISGKLNDSPWIDFIFHPKYSAIVDMYEGGYNHLRGVWRSENESVMNTYIPYYNTISRYAIYKQIMHRAGLTPTLEEFIANDKIEIPE